MPKKTPTEDLGTRLCKAVSDANEQLVEELLAQKADVNAVGDRRVAMVAHSTPLWIAVNVAGMFGSESWNEFTTALTEVFPQLPKRNDAEKRKCLVNIVRKLIAAGADLEKPSFGTTPLHLSVTVGALDLIQLFLAAGANPNAEAFSPMSSLAKTQLIKGPLGRMGYFETAVHTAVRKKSLPILQALLQAGADPNRTDHEGKTPTQLAIENRMTEFVECLGRALAR